MKIPDCIGDEEELGRGVFSSKEAKRARKAKKPRLQVFLCPEGMTEISVDRFGFAPCNEMADISRERAVKRQRTFYGWVVVTAQRTVSQGLEVEAAPQPDNPYHANIVLPDADAREECAQMLADIAEWREPPKED